MNISIVEFAVYAFVAYSSLLMLIISISQEGGMIKTRRGTLVKSIYIMPGITCMILLSGSGVDIFLNESAITTTEIIINGSTGALITNSTVTTESIDKFVLQNPVWITLHYMFALIMFAYVIINVLKMFSASD